MTASTKVIIIGAGPYGLSIASHLRAAGIDFRIFGKPMQSWCSGMPARHALEVGVRRSTQAEYRPENEGIRRLLAP